jgi:hypothetical protein
VKWVVESFKYNTSTWLWLVEKIAVCLEEVIHSVDVMFPFCMLAIKFLDFSKRCHAVISFDFQSNKPVWSLKRIDDFFGRNKKIFLVANVVFCT